MLDLLKFKKDDIKDGTIWFTVFMWYLILMFLYAFLSEYFETV